MCKNNAFDAKIVNTHLTKIFIAIFAAEERLPSSATLFCGCILGSSKFLLCWVVFCGCVFGLLLDPSIARSHPLTSSVVNPTNDLSSVFDLPLICNLYFG